MGLTQLNEQVIASTPFPANPNLDQIVRWIEKVAPCLIRGGIQTEQDTGLVIDHLRWKQRLPDEIIGAALVKSSYKWTVPMRHAGVSTSMYIAANQQAGTTTPQTSMGSRGKPDKDAIKLRAAALGARYSANPHNPEVQEKARRELLELLNQLPDSGADDPMPGRGRMQSERERIARIQEEILLTAGELGRQTSLQLGPLGEHRARGGFAPKPDARNTPYRPPNLRNMPRR